MYKVKGGEEHAKGDKLNIYESLENLATVGNTIGNTKRKGRKKVREA